MKRPRRAPGLIPGRSAIPAVLALALFASGCGDLLGKLRPDQDDSGSGGPTTGGLWAERGFLSDSPPDRGDLRDYGGRSERGPASEDTASGSGDPWGSSDRDAAGGDQVSFDNTPNFPPATRRRYKNGDRATQADFIDQSQNEGSLWAPDGQTNYYFTKNKVRAVGDILTVKLGSDLIRDIGLEVKRTLNDNERAIELSLAEDRARARAQAGRAAAGGGKDALSTSQAAPAQGPGGGGSPDTVFGAPSVDVRPSDIDVSKSLELKPGDTMMAEIVERYPNGNYRIRGTKMVIYRNGAPRLVHLTAVVGASDISDDGTVDSGKLYEYRLEATPR